ncbi:hypothetical protein SCB29_33875 [Paraburkholderia sp. SIMBA_055]
MVGLASKSLNGDGANSVTKIENYYRITSMSFAEERKWERLVPFIFGKLSIVATKTLATVLTDSAILLSASDTNETDLLAISKDGDLISGKEICRLFHAGPTDSKRRINTIVWYRFGQRSTYPARDFVDA